MNPDDLRRNTDNLNAALGVAEQVLITQDWGVAARIPVHANSRTGALVVDLWFCRRGSTWGLFVRTDPGADLEALQSTSRAVRIACAHALPQLRSALQQAVVAENEDVIAATAAVVATINDFETA